MLAKITKFFLSFFPFIFLLLFFVSLFSFVGEVHVFFYFSK